MCFSSKVTLRTGEVHKSRFSRGIYVKYKTQNDEEYTVTETKMNTLSPEFNHTKIFSIPNVTQETLDWFDSGCITFLMYGRQEDCVADPKLSKMTTKVLFWNNTTMVVLLKVLIISRNPIYETLNSCLVRSFRFLQVLIIES